MALYSYRISPISKLGVSPFNLLYGREPSSFIIATETASVSRTSEEIISNIEAKRNSAIQKAIDIRNMEIVRAVEDNSSLNLQSFQPGEIVMKLKEKYETGHKLNDKWAGPFIVVNVKPKGAYTIKSLSGATFEYNQAKLKKYYGFDEEEWKILKEEEVLPGESLLSINCTGPRTLKILIKVLLCPRKHEWER
ncbi:hypothetical protein ENBRE01_1752 [Enteropsectra breve]|nr:hypothetical protein ENBRE01_1752 [Enteropsectra breve]